MTTTQARRLLDTAELLDRCPTGTVVAKAVQAVRSLHSTADESVLAPLAGRLAEAIRRYVEHAIVEARPSDGSDKRRRGGGHGYSGGDGFTDI